MAIKLLVIADTVTNPSKILQGLEMQPDLIITLGDLNLEDLLSIAKTNIPKVGVYGNHCEAGYLERLRIENLHLKVIDFLGFRVAGFEGCVKYKNSPFQYTQKEASKLLASFPRVDMFISHASPLGINDNPSDDSHLGFEAFRTYIENHSPQIWIHGHSYPDASQKISRYKDTVILYVNDVEFIDLSELDLSNLPPARSYTR